MLQKEKRLISGFDEWYPAWQELMRADPLMKWLVNSRNRIVKIGDLEVHSTAHIRIVHSYFDVADSLEDNPQPPTTPKAESGPEKAKSVPPWTPPTEYLQYLRSIPQIYLEQSALAVERRWIDKALPGSELLSALGHCYGVLTQLVADAHEREDGRLMTVRSTRTGGEVISKAGSQYGGRLPCMVVTADVRTTHYRVHDGSLVNEDTTRHFSGKFDLKRSLRRYKVDLGELLSRTRPRTALDYVDPMFTQAKSVLSKDKHHSHIVILTRGEKILDVSQAILADRQAKFLFAQQLAKAVLLAGADGVVTINEMWQSEPVLDEEGAMIPPAQAPDRREVLRVYAETSDGQTRHKSVEFTRRFGRIVFGREIFSENAGLENNIMSPTRVVWKTRSKEREREANRSIAQILEAGSEE
ncbi:MULTISPECIES: hypothetical protein [unclassified Pseudonocardia]|uniref:hypothetical protein n=1 Tax=unclassified Pseudonocardia TaxID=2619320 RepID=UPI0011153B8A|nr:MULTISPECIES: hypothetical protein [unclassified Pseudonocardia]